MGTGLLSAMAAVGAVVSGLRGAWIVSLGFVALSTYLAQRTRVGLAGRSSEPHPAMSRREACAILGVSETAERAEIQAAYRRLIRMAHPDQGGSAGLAAQINAARDCLLKG
jgi:DnaJ-domain-containing protein 1